MIIDKRVLARRRHLMYGKQFASFADHVTLPDVGVLSCSTCIRFSPSRTGVQINYANFSRGQDVQNKQKQNFACKNKSQFRSAQTSIIEQKKKETALNEVYFRHASTVLHFHCSRSKVPCHLNFPQSPYMANKLAIFFYEHG